MNTQPQIIEQDEGAIGVLKDIRRGNVVAELDDAITEVVAAIEENQGGSGKVTLTIGVSYDNSTQAYKVTGKVVPVLPKKKEHASLFFATPGNKLTRANPNQRDMFPERV